MVTSQHHPPRFSRIIANTSSQNMAEMIPFEFKCFGTHAAWSPPCFRSNHCEFITVINVSLGEKMDVFVNIKYQTEHFYVSI